MFQLTVLIPVRDNAGIPFADGDFAAFEGLVLSLFGGMTRLPEMASGLWAAAGVTYVDDCRIYLVAVASIGDGGKVSQIVAFAKATFNQKAIFVAYLGIVEIL